MSRVRLAREASPRASTAELDAETLRAFKESGLSQPGGEHFGTLAHE